MDRTCYSEQLRLNGEIFRNAMERIFQKYSHLDDSGPDVCMKTMTFTSGKGSVPLNSATAEKELQDLMDQLKKKSIHTLDSAQDEHTLFDQDVTLPSCKTEIGMVNLDHSRQMENSTSSQWCGSETFQRSLTSMSSSRTSLWDKLSQPEEEDPDLERTLNGNGSTLLDVYPSLLNQIGEAYRRQHMTNAASAVLRRYRRMSWHSSRAQHRSHNSSDGYSHSLNRMRESVHTTPKPAHNKITNPQKSTFMYQGSSPHKSKTDFSLVLSVSDSSHVSRPCFYSPRKEDMTKKTGEENGSICWTGVRVLDLSAPPSPGSSPRSPSPNLDHVYVVKPVPLPRFHRVPDSPVSGATWSPLTASLASQKCNTVNLPPPNRHAGLCRDRVCSTSPQKALTDQLPQLRSPLKPKRIGDYQTSWSYPKQALPVIHTSEVCRSPYQGQRYSSPSSHQKNISIQLKPLPSSSNHYSLSSSVSRMASRQIDAKFTSLYHHFICRSTNPTSSCHLCKRRSGVQNPTVSSTSMSALSLTPVRNRVKKRHREPEVVEMLRFKRLRESCSPQRTLQFWPNQQQETCNEYVNSAMAESNEDKYTRNRALLLQCPSPGFLRAIRQSGSGSNGWRPDPILDPQTHYSSSWNKSLRCPGAGQGSNSEVSEGSKYLDGGRFARSSIGTWDQNGVSAQPRVSRRRLLSDF